MATVDTVTSVFLKYSLTKDEQIHGTIFTQTQLQYMQNERAKIAEQKIALEFDPLNPVLFAQTEALLKGQLEVYTFLIEQSEFNARVLATAK